MARGSACARRRGGINLRGIKARECANGQWGNYGVCTDPDVCILDENRSTPNACGFNQRGILFERCPGGRWLVDQCEDPDICQDGTNVMVDCGALGQTGTCVDGQVIFPPGC
jgi:hypothetical protein